MEQKIKLLETLIEEGKKWNYDNFATKTSRGFPEFYNPDYVTWRTRARRAMERLFAPGSAPLEALEAGLSVVVLGNSDDKFDRASSYLIRALETGLEVLKDDVFGELVTTAEAPGHLSNKVFVVHGHDHLAKNELEHILSELGLQPIVLHRQADEGQTIIEKIEKHGGVGFAFILLTPDEISYLRDEDIKPDDERQKEYRPRPNVIFEFGYFVGLLGRSRVCCLHTGDVVLPSDLSGLLYKPFSKGVEDAYYGITKELKAAGYTLKL